MTSTRSACFKVPTTVLSVADGADLTFNEVPAELSFTYFMVIGLVGSSSLVVPHFPPHHLQEVHLSKPIHLYNFRPWWV